MRYTAGCGLDSDYDPHDKAFNLSASAHGAISLAEGTLKLDTSLPNASGWHLKFYGLNQEGTGLSNTLLDFGAFRAKFHFG